MKILKLQNSGKSVYQLLTGVLCISFDSVGSSAADDSICLYRNAQYRATILVEHKDEFTKCLGVVEAGE